MTNQGASLPVGSSQYCSRKQPVHSDKLASICAAHNLSCSGTGPSGLAGITATTHPQPLLKRQVKELSRSGGSWAGTGEGRGLKRRGGKSSACLDTATSARTPGGVMASPSCPPLLSLSPARSHRSTNHSVKWKGTELPVCGEGEDSPRVLTSRSAGMGVGDPGTGESGRSPGKAHSEGRGKETKRKGKHKQQQKKQRVGAPTRVAEPRQGPVRGGCEAGSVHPRGGARDARGRNCTVVRNAAIGKGRRGPAARPGGAGTATSGGTPDGAAGRKRRGGLRPGQG